MKILNLSKSYGAQAVFQDFSLDINDGEILCILGPSGCGKTTLLNCLAGLTTYGGEIVDGFDRVGYVFQEDRLIPFLTARQNLAFVGIEKERAEELIKETELLDVADKKPSALSGGEKRRVALARAFGFGAPALLMDEPFTGLDTALKIKIAKLFIRLWEQEKKTVVFVTHDLEEATALAHRVVVIKNGSVCADVRLKDRALPSFFENGEEKERLLKAMDN